MEARDRLARVGLGPVDEGQEAGQSQVALVLGGRGRLAVRVPRRDRDHAGPFAEQALQDAGAFGRHADAPRQHCLGGALGDDQEPMLGILDERGRELARVIEGQDADPPLRRRRSRRP
jgi:hypothetical protein